MSPKTHCKHFNLQGIFSPQGRMAGAEKGKPSAPCGGMGCSARAWGLSWPWRGTGEQRHQGCQSGSQGARGAGVHAESAQPTHSKTAEGAALPVQRAWLPHRQAPQRKRQVFATTLYFVSNCP